jgi:hypothetical protein
VIQCEEVADLKAPGAAAAAGTILAGLDLYLLAPLNEMKIEPVV